MTFESKLKEVREKGKLISWRRAFQAEERATGKALECHGKQNAEGARVARAERRR